MDNDLFSEWIRTRGPILAETIARIHLREGVNYTVPQTISFEASETLQIKIRVRESLIDWLIAQGID